MVVSEDSMPKIKRAFKKQSLKCHPDKPGGSSEAMRAVIDAMRRIELYVVNTTTPPQQEQQQQREREEQRAKERAEAERMHADALEKMRREQDEARAAREAAERDRKAAEEEADAMERALEDAEVRVDGVRAERKAQEDREGFFFAQEHEQRHEQRREKHEVLKKGNVKVSLFINGRVRMMYESSQGIALHLRFGGQEHVVFERLPIPPMPELPATMTGYGFLRAKTTLPRDGPWQEIRAEWAVNGPNGAPHISPHPPELCEVVLMGRHVHPNASNASGPGPVAAFLAHLNEARAAHASAEAEAATHVRHAKAALFCATAAGLSRLAAAGLDAQVNRWDPRAPVPIDFLRVDAEAHLAQAALLRPEADSRAPSRAPLRACEDALARRRVSLLRVKIAVSIKLRGDNEGAAAAAAVVHTGNLDYPCR